jgi:hypothetical protein
LVGLFVASCVIVALTVFFPEDVLLPTSTWAGQFLDAALPWVAVGLIVAIGAATAATRQPTADPPAHM